MKKLILFLCMILIASSATAADYIELQPGLYKVGEDIATGKYDIRFNDLDKTVSVLYSEELKDSLPDLSKEMSFSFTFSSESNWWNIGGFVVRLFPGYLLIENSPVRLWIEE